MSTDGKEPYEFWRVNSNGDGTYNVTGEAGISDVVKSVQNGEVDFVIDPNTGEALMRMADDVTGRNGKRTNFGSTKAYRNAPFSNKKRKTND